MVTDEQRVLLGYMRTRVSRRKVLLMLGILMLVVLICVAAIGLMLRRLEAQNASFHPPMTESEREQLLPPEPRLEVAPSVDGLRYGKQVGLQRDNVDSLSEEPSAEKGLLDRQTFHGYSNGAGNHSEDVSRAH
ncbi:MAG TPA: hypothetical protein VGC62_09000 [Pseudomonas sp.]|uniref:hypothetical protein n=1 Tax=Pseudomonas sp. TaxID=306 RepID=UPI002EDA04A5